QAVREEVHVAVRKVVVGWLLSEEHAPDVIQLYVTGHSMGGSLAAHCAMDLKMYTVDKIQARLGDFARRRRALRDLASHPLAGENHHHHHHRQLQLQLQQQQQYREQRDEGRGIAAADDDAAAAAAGAAAGTAGEEANVGASPTDGGDKRTGLPYPTLESCATPGAFLSLETPMSSRRGTAAVEALTSMSSLSSSNSKPEPPPPPPPVHEEKDNGGGGGNNAYSSSSSSFSSGGGGGGGGGGGRRENVLGGGGDGEDRPSTGAVELSLFSFGAPRAGNPRYAARYNAAVPRSFRIVVDGDPVPGLPTWRYGHAGTKVLIDGRGMGPLILDPSLAEQRLFPRSERRHYVHHHDTGRYRQGLRGRLLEVR
ncbi:unnamed protein product, partial [Ectocarpus fasciculatus]